MEPPYKRQRLYSRENTDADLRRKRVQNDQRLKSIFESIFEKYEKNFEGVGDEIDLETGQIVVDNGHILGMKHEKDAGYDDEDALFDPGGDSFENAEFSGQTDSVASDDEVDEISVADPINEERIGLEVVKSTVIDSDPNAIQSSVTDGTAEEPHIYDYEDELGDGGFLPVNSLCLRLPRHDHWRLPNHDIVFEAEKAADPKWSAPPLPVGTPRHTPLHRRITLPVGINLSSTGTDYANLGPNPSIWAIKSRRQRRKQAPDIALDRHPSNERGTHPNQSNSFETWTASNERTLRYLKRNAQVSYNGPVEYFPQQTEQNLAWHWDSVQVESDDNDDDEDPDLAHHCYRSVRESFPHEPSPSDLVGSGNGDVKIVNEHYESQYIISNNAPAQALAESDESHLYTQHTSLEYNHARSQRSVSLTLLDQGPGLSHPIIGQDRGDTNPFQPQESPAETINNQDLIYEQAFIRHIDSHRSEGVAHGLSIENDVPLETVKDGYSSNVDLKEVPDSDSPMTASPPLATVRVDSVAPTKLAIPIRSSPRLWPAPFVSEDQQPAHAIVSLSGSNDAQCTVADQSKDPTSSPSDLSTPDCNAHRTSKENSTSSLSNNPMVETSFESRMEGGKEALEVQHRSTKKHFGAMKQLVSVVIPLRKQQYRFGELIPHGQSTIEMPANVSEEGMPAGERTLCSLLYDSEASRPTPETDHNAGDGLENGVRGIPDSQTSQNVESIADGAEDIMHVVSMALQNEQDIEQATLATDRRKHEDIGLNDSQPACNNEPKSQTAGPLLVSDVSVGRLAIHDSTVKAAKDTMATPFLSEADDSSEDDLNISPTAAKSRRVAKPALLSPVVKIKFPASLIDCSDDELAG